MKKIISLLPVLEKHKLLKEFHVVKEDVFSLEYDSRLVTEKTLFICKGAGFKPDYLDKAITLGAMGYVSEHKYRNDCSYIIVSDIRKTMSLLALEFYDHPEDKLTLIGVTGTKGKSSTTHILKSILDEYLPSPCGLLSSIKIIDGVVSKTASLTTPESLDLVKSLNNAVNSNMTHMIIETSSQALKMDRVFGLMFDVAVILNLDEDHVSDIEHPDLEDYLQSKISIMNMSRMMVINLDSNYFNFIENNLNSPYLSFSSTNNADYKLDYYYLEKDHIKFGIKHNHQVLEYQLNMVGKYNIENALAAIVICSYLNVDYQSMKEGLLHVEVEGREQIFTSDDKQLVCFVSYAHNGLSFQKAYEFIREKYSQYKVISLFGNSGKLAMNRIIPNCKYAGENSDEVIIIPEDNEYLSFDEIAQVLKNELRKYTDHIKVVDSREEGIKLAASNMDGKTLLFIAGKGDETFQKENGHKILIKSDIEVSKEVIDTYNKMR